MTLLTRKNTEALQDRFALRAVSYLASDTTDLPHEITERLRAARCQAVSSRKVARTLMENQVTTQGNSATLHWGGDQHSQKWSRGIAFVSLALLVIGLLFINVIQSDNRAQELADIDVALLTDALPPAAFSDPGFVQFLKSAP